MELLWGALAVLIAGAVGSPITLAVLRLARTVDRQESAQQGIGQQEISQPESDQPLPAHAVETPAPEEVPTPDKPGVLRGGLVIGILERVAVALAILLNEPVAIAYVIAIKGLGRYAELKETPAAAERFIIGTLTSLLWACAVAGLTAVYLV
ncbi:hypothetical protein GC088_05585 [Arthrobacter sp. JZ12]|uniref:hypothetical protein n=1 Tax=Arthrobacter sp. JZ12 TaxID=2654190 RepID=UPI002B462F97|nr:hypothetical protein [Arthrobacter sp. JZ12]WRH24594.1 hypothetical protein GC088_05585 [Arthrobacter sp. JZ12]